ncbi:MAG: hypothetical protein LQ342_005203 [Letrouitia transgressa]|nr:MAG: hypothetical protein LQ342_005203 [Letrouitia transgressa]
MPSVLEEHVSEPVSLSANGSSPYEPPHHTYEKPPLNSRNVGPAADKGPNNILDREKYPDENLTNGFTPSYPNLQPLKTDKPSRDVDDGRTQLSPTLSNHAKPNGLDDIQPCNAESLVPSNVESRGGKMDDTSPGMNGVVTPHAKRVPPTIYQTSQTRTIQRSGHARAHSSSAPQKKDIPSIYGSSGDVSHGAGKSNVSLPSSRNDPQASNRFSSPPTLPNPTPSPVTASPLSIHPGAVRLQHRHTLQVPRLSTGRTSRDFSLPINTTSDEMSADTERLSPTIAGPSRGSISLARRPTRSIHSDMYLDEIPQDEDMARWTETIRQKRANRRKKKEEEEDDRVVVGTKVDMNHVNWVTAYNMLTGIRFTVSRTNAKIDRELTDADFDARHKFSFDITGNELTPSAKYDFKFKDYAPWVFRHIRARFKLDPADYLVSLTSKYILSELGSPGKSGSFFYFSRDYKYIIKTIHHAEHKILRKILREYYAHIERHPNTLLSQFYGLHRVKIPYGRKIHFVVMNNLFPPHRDIHQTFDLKGSTVGRDFKEEDLERNPRATLKDLNWLRRNYHFEFGPSKKKLFVEQMKRDVELLQRLQIMDYSLLVGIHDLSRGNEENLRDRTLQVFQPGADRSAEPQPNLLTRTPSKLENQRKARELRQIIKKEKPVPMEKSASKMPDEMLEERKSFIFYSDDGGFQATHEDGEPGEEIYYLGIIDCLTHYGLTKRAEHLWKGMSNNKSQISPIPPQNYGERFVKFITGLTKTKEEAVREGQSTDQTDGSIHTTRGSSFQLSADKVVERAEKQAHKTEKQGSSEDSHSDRTLGALRSSSAERTGGTAGTTLPVVQEDGEGGSREDSLHKEQQQGFQPQDNVNPPTGGDQTTTSSDKQTVDKKHLPSLPFIPRLSMNFKSGAITNTAS